MTPDEAKYIADKAVRDLAETYAGELDPSDPKFVLSLKDIELRAAVCGPLASDFLCHVADLDRDFLTRAVSGFVWGDSETRAACTEALRISIHSRLLRAITRHYAREASEYRDRLMWDNEARSRMWEDA